MRREETKPRPPNPVNDSGVAEGSRRARHVRTATEHVVKTVGN